MERFLKISIVLLILFGGCATLLPPVENSEPNTPVYSEPPDPVGAGIDFAKVLGALWPPLIPIATAAGGIWAGVKRLQPKLKEAQSNQEKYFAGGQALANVLEDIKTNQPELWEKIGPKIADATIATNDIGAAIDGFRGKT